MALINIAAGCILMQYLAELSREHPAMAVEELEQVLSAESDRYEIHASDHDAGGRNLVWFETDATVPFDRLAMTFRVLSIVATASSWSEIEARDGLEQSFCVRSCSDELPKDELERTLGGRIAERTGAPVDLDAPAVWFGVYTIDRRVILAREEVRIPRGSFENRRSHHRPFSAPVSLHPELARSLVNLSGVGTGGTVLDPFCGTGGILLEAALMGCDPVGTDMSKEMVEGARENLDAFDVDGRLEQADAREALDRFGAVDTVVTDLPYGHASLSEGSIPELVEGFVADDRVGTCVFVSDKSSLCGWEPVFSIYVHKSLSRHIYRRE